MTRLFSQIFLMVFFIINPIFSHYITSEIQGQLGNQMFQVAAGIAYALDHGYEARFPQLKSAIRGELNLEHVFHRLNVEDFPSNTTFFYYTEKGATLYAPIHELGYNLCLQGYFAHEKYFAHHADFLRELFAPKEELVEEIHAKYGSFLNGPTVAVHIRTFFPDQIDPNQGVGRTNWNYFLKAIDHFPSTYTILIFSDAPEWVRDHFPLIRPNIHFIAGNPHYFDFYFISLCDHQVISPKSTFAWWGAWLNRNPDKIVIRAEDGWAEDEAFPPSWIKFSMD